MLIIQSLEKVRSKLKVSEKAKRAIPSEKTIDFYKDNVTRKKNVLKNSEDVDHKGINFGRENFNHVTKLVTIAKKKEKGPYKKYTAKDRYNIGKYASDNGPIPAVQKFRLKFSNLNESAARSMRKKYEEELNQALRGKQTPATAITSKHRGRPLMLGDLDVMVQNYLRIRFVILLC